MKDLVWDNVLSVGVDEIDDDHQKLIRLFNILNRAISDGESKDYLAAVLDELINCTVWHFSHEERLMLKHHYQALAQHQAEHQELIRSAQELQQEILHSKADYTDEHLQFLERWLTEHILTSDGRLGAYLSRVM